MTALRTAEQYDAYVEGMKNRTKQFALRVVKLVRVMQRDSVLKIIAGQLLRAGTSVGANYRAACRARTGAEFTNKMRIVLEEADESQFWMEVLIEGELMPARLLIPLHKESTELTAIFTRALNTSQRR